MKPVEKKKVMTALEKVENNKKLKSELNLHFDAALLGPNSKKEIFLILTRFRNGLFHLLLRY